MCARYHCARVRAARAAQPLCDSDPGGLGWPGGPQLLAPLRARPPVPARIGWLVLARLTGPAEYIKL